MYIIQITRLYHRAWQTYKYKKKIIYNTLHIKMFPSSVLWYFREILTILAIYRFVYEHRTLNDTYTLHKFMNAVPKTAEQQFIYCNPTLQFVILPLSRSFPATFYFWRVSLIVLSLSINAPEYFIHLFFALKVKTYGALQINYIELLVSKVVMRYELQRSTEWGKKLIMPVIYIICEFIYIQLTTNCYYFLIV